ncbi:hypothetical protein ElyMa_001545500 [Elysia marginata]|uniref:Uncharacterized protein n=1 Tax=Elysia marginata TaxID=1093978 RepID=A0AAV4J9G7_9GAST|nr:hypothetical protein ElyMa_001545500 [Elysia marginata]
MKVVSIREDLVAVVTAALEKHNKNQITSWLKLDGPSQQRVGESERGERDIVSVKVPALGSDIASTDAASESDDSSTEIGGVEE